MKFKKLKLYTNRLEAELAFYSQRLGLPLINRDAKSFTIKIGWSELSFEKSEKQHRYHYCFLIPSNKLKEALLWMEQKTELIEIEAGRKIQNFETWNADSFYFFDASGNIAEFIVRYDLENMSDQAFDQTSILAINEMGMPSNNVSALNHQLETQINSKFWKGDLERFATNGTQEGLLLLPNYALKSDWFPSNIRMKAEPFEALISQGSALYNLSLIHI